MARLRSLTLNIWNRMGPWEKRKELIQRGLKKLDADLVGLQEVVSSDGVSQANELADGLKYRVAFGPAMDLGNEVFFGNALLSRFPIAMHRTFPIFTREGEDKRSMLLARIDHPLGPLTVCVTHLNWMFHHGVVRERQVLDIAQIIKREVRPAELPTILMGDFNAEPDAAEMRFMRGLQSLDGESVYFADGFGLAGKGQGVTYNAAKNPYAAQTHEPPRRIDYIFVRGPDTRGRGRPMKAEVVFDEVRKGVAPSDHYGVIVETSL